MQSKKLLEASNVLKNLGIQFTYTGSMEHSDIEYLCESIESYLKAAQYQRPIISKVLSTFIELSQNIHHYLSKKASSTFFNKVISDSVVICIGNKNNSFFIYAGNWIENIDVPEMEDLLNHLYSIPKIELDIQYKIGISSTDSKAKDDTKLGLMQLIRKSQKVEHEVISKDDNWSFILFKVTL
jgi:hypothetical protein